MSLILLSCGGFVLTYGAAPVALSDPFTSHFDLLTQVYGNDETFHIGFRAIQVNGHTVSVNGAIATIYDPGMAIAYSPLTQTLDPIDGTRGNLMVLTSEPPPPKDLGSSGILLEHEGHLLVSESGGEVYFLAAVDRRITVIRSLSENLDSVSAKLGSLRFLSARADADSRTLESVSASGYVNEDSVPRKLYEIIQPSIRRDTMAQAYMQILYRLELLPYVLLYTYALDTTLVDGLPFLAEQFDVTGYEGWFWTRSTEERRQLIRNSHSLHQLKGTYEGYRNLLRMARSELRRFVAPPSHAYPGPSWSVEERNAFLDLMPALRTYKFKTRGTKQGFFTGDILHQGMTGDNHPSLRAGNLRKFPILSDAIERFFERVFYVTPDGVETPVTSYIRQVDYSSGVGKVTYRTQIPGGGPGLFPWNEARPGETGVPGALKGKRFVIDKRPGDRIFTYRLDEPYRTGQESLHKRAMVPSENQITVQYDVLKVPERQNSMIADRLFPGRGFTHSITSTARHRLSKEVHLHDQSVRLLPRLQSEVFSGVSRFGIPTYNAELHITYQSKDHRPWLWRYIHGFTRPHDPTKLHDIAKGVNEYRLARDKILLTSKSKQPLSFSGGLIFGESKVGEFVSDR